MSILDQRHDLSDAWVYSSERADGGDLKSPVGMHKACERSVAGTERYQEVASVFETAAR